MTELDPALAAAFAQQRVLFFTAVEILTPGGPVRLLDGAGEVPIDGNTFVGRNPTWGVLGSIRGLSEAMEDSAPALTITLYPANDTALSDMLDPALQGSPVTVLIGAIDQATGLPIGEPYVPFVGELDVPTVDWQGHQRTVEVLVGSVGERLQAVEEGIRLSDTFHQSVYPGELGLAFVTEIETWVPWGQALKTDAATIRSDLPGYGASTPASMGGVLAWWGSRHS